MTGFHAVSRGCATPHRLVFLDEPKVRVSETPVKTTMTRLRGRSPAGDRLFGTAPFGKWQTQTFIAGLTCTDLVAPWVIKAAMDRTAFDTYIETRLTWGNDGVIVAALALAACLGIVQGASFAAIPQLNPRPEDRARAAGAVAQLGNLGTTTGTPLLALLMQKASVNGLALFLLGFSLLGLAIHLVQAGRRTAVRPGLGLP